MWIETRGRVGWSYSYFPSIFVHCVRSKHHFLRKIICWGGTIWNHLQNGETSLPAFYHTGMASCLMVPQISWYWILLPLWPNLSHASLKRSKLPVARLWSAVLNHFPTGCAFIRCIHHEDVCLVKQERLCSWTNELRRWLSFRQRQICRRHAWSSTIIKWSRSFQKRWTLRFHFWGHALFRFSNVFENRLVVCCWRFCLAIRPIVSCSFEVKIYCIDYF